MSISARLKEERLRLGLSQTAWGEIGGVTKSALIKWESGTSSSPTAPALAAFAEAGADVLYVLTGKRAEEKRHPATENIEEDLKEMERDLIEPARHLLPGQSEADAEEQTITGIENRLNAMLKYDTPFMDDELIERVESLLDVTRNPAKLSLLRALDFAQKRQKRDRLKEKLSAFVDDTPYEPNDTVRNALVMIALEYGVPIRMLAEVIYDIYLDISGSPRFVFEEEVADPSR